MGAAELLDLVAEGIASGWCQGAFADNPEHRYSQPATKRCLSGWLFYESERASVAGTRFVEAVHALQAEAKVGHHPHCEFKTLATWNDAPGRTQQEVYELVIRAAGRVRRQQQRHGEK